jgi:low affinity Fe/Cu permease
MADEPGAVHRIGCRISAAVAHFSADPLAQVGFILLCLAWSATGLNVNILTAALSILAITLTQMVLNSQGERERDAHRRDVALHAKLDELLLASRRARDELAGIEELEEEEIEQLKNGGPLAQAAE